MSRLGVLKQIGQRGGPLLSSFFASASIQLLNVLTGVLLARELGPARRGELVTALLWPTILASLGSLGMAEAATYHAARQTRPLPSLVGSSLLLAVGQSAIFVAIGAVILPLVVGHHARNALGPAYLFLTYVPLNMITTFFGGILNGLERYRAFNVLRVLVIALTASGLVGLALTNRMTVENAVLVYLMANAVTTLAVCVIVVRVVQGRLTVEREMWRALLAFGWRTHVSNVSNVLNERGDQLLISIFLRPAQLGLYVVAVTLTAVTSLIGGSLSIVALPSLAKRDDAERRALTRLFVLISVVATTLVTIPVLIFTPVIIRLAFGASFLPATGVARVLLVATIIYADGRVIAAALKAANRPLDAGVAELIGLGVTVVSLAALLPALGILGAGLASLLAYSASTLWMVRQAVRSLNMTAAELLIPRGSDARRLIAMVRAGKS